MMSHPHEGPMSEGREGGLDALMELGSVPVHLLHGINNLFDHLNRAIRESAPRPSKRAIVVGILAVGALLLAACSDGHPIPAHIQEAMLSSQISMQRESERLQAQLVANQEENPTLHAPTEQPNPYENWTFQYAEVKADELGVLAVLERAYGVAPHKFADLPKGQIQVFVIIGRDGINRAYDWDNLLSRSPVVYPGDQIYHDIFTLSKFSEYRQNQNIPEENVFVVR